jgi:phosphoribosyl 1,2-cyclic phosphodiesterase
VPIEQEMKFEFCSLGSGSSGNCYYLGNGFQGILIDAGISAGSIRSYLKQMGIPISTIMGVLITHNHFDHVKGIEVLVKKNHIPIFTTNTIWSNMGKNPNHQNIPIDCRKIISVLQKFHLAGFDIEAFPVHHDAPETLGYQISVGGRKITIVTDLGHICSTSAAYLKNSNFIVIESNYDEQMLLDGNYPYYLKKRISASNGHLSNQQTSDFLAEIIHDGISHICLAHLSKNNNTPEQAFQTLHKSLFQKGIMLNGNPRLLVLNRDLTPEMITILD